MNGNRQHINHRSFILTPREKGLDIIPALHGDEPFEVHFIFEELEFSFFVSLPRKIEDIFDREGEIFGPYEELFLEQEKNITDLKAEIENLVREATGFKDVELYVRELTKVSRVVDAAFLIGGPLIVVT